MTIAKDVLTLTKISLKRSDYEVVVGAEPKESKQFFTIRTMYFGLTKHQLYNSINLIIKTMKDFASVRYAYAVDADTREIVTFDDIPKPITKSEDLKWIK